MKTGTANAHAAAAKRRSRAIRSEGGVATRGSSHEISHRQPGRENWRSVLSSAIPKQLSVPSHTDPRAVAHGEMSPINRARRKETRNGHAESRHRGSGRRFFFFKQKTAYEI